MENPTVAATRIEADVTGPRSLSAGQGPHRPILLREVMHYLDPQPGDIAVDCTIGSGAHARAILEAIKPGGRLIGIDVDAGELQRTERRLREAGYGPETFAARQANFAQLPDVLAAEGLSAANLLLVDLGVSSMQTADPGRGFSYKVPGPLDMRMNTSGGETVSQLLARISEAELASILIDNADEPHADVIARLIAGTRVTTTHLLERTVRIGLNHAVPTLTKSETKMAVRRTFQALRIAVNDEINSLEALLRALPQCLAPGGRVVFVTFHSGEDRRVKKALKAGLKHGDYSSIAVDVVRSAKDETYADRRAMAAKLRWAVRAR